MARPQREAPSEIICHSRRSHRIRRSPEGHRAPKTPGAVASQSVASALAKNLATHGHKRIVSKLLIGLCGQLAPKQVTQGHIEKVAARIRESKSAFTRSRRISALRHVLRELSLEYGTKDLARHVPRALNPRPRNVTATDYERARLIDAASPAVKCWLLLCSDLAIRSGTAASLGPTNYDKSARCITFTTKYQLKQRLPVTSELAELLDLCPDPTLPFVVQLPCSDARFRTGIRPPNGTDQNAKTLHKAYHRLKAQCGITRSLNPHDLRRTTATRAYNSTKDLRTVQAILGHSNLSSTLWYLDHDARPVDRELLEAIKLPTNPVATPKGVQ